MTDREALGRTAYEVDAGVLLHCYLVTGTDGGALIEYCLTVARYTMCKSLCGKCGDCLKILSGNHTSVELFQKDKFSVDDISEIIYKSNLKAMEGGSKFFIISDAGTLNPASQNKLLKTLEDAPDSTHFFLCTTKPDMLLSTVRSRSSKIALPLVSRTKIFDTFEENAGEEVAELVSRYAGGSMSRAKDIIKDTNKLDAVKMVDCLPDRLRTSRDVLDVSDKLCKNAKIMPLVLDLIEIKYGEMLEQSTDVYSPAALAYIIEEIIESKKKVNSNCNVQSIIDKLLFRILEVRQKYAHSS